MEDFLRDILEAFELEDNLYTEDDYYTEDLEEEENDDEE